jgi:hypothetical protein
MLLAFDLETVQVKIRYGTERDNLAPQNSTGLRAYLEALNSNKFRTPDLIVTQPQA